MQPSARRSKNGITYHDARAFWIGSTAVTLGVFLNFPIFFGRSNIHYVLAHAKADGSMMAGLALIFGGTALAFFGLMPRGALAGATSASRAHIRIKAMDDARLTAAHYKLMAVLCVAIAVDTLKPFTFAFILPGGAAEYNLNSPSHLAPGHWPAALFPIAGITGTTIG
jgi:putative MFS transporter